MPKPQKFRKYAEGQVRVCSHCGSILPAPSDDEAEEVALTERQIEILGHIAQGRTAKQIAAVLQVSSRTVEFHRAMLMQRLGINNTAELTLYAAARRLI